MWKRRAEQAPEVHLDPGSFVEITPLGAGSEVGRSCIILKYLGKTVMFDCGIHPGFSGHSALPFLDEVDLPSVDVALITHFHLDHCAAVPYLVGRTNFKGRLFMTHPTKAIFNTLLKDFCKLSRGEQGEGLFGEEDLVKAVERTEVLDFGQTISPCEGVRVTAYRAGHVLGAAMFMVEIGGMRCLYTGDYSRVRDRHMPAAEVPERRPHIVICEATYGVNRHLPREQREQRFIDTVRRTVMNGGRVLLPVVALGRAQELLLLLEEAWERTPALRHVPIYQASSLAKNATSVFQTYIEMMNDDIKAAFDVRGNPFEFKHIRVLRNPSQFDDSGPCVLMATPSMLQSGLSREMFEAWCEDARNTIIICDFAVQGTLAREIQSAPTHVLTRLGTKVPLRMHVEVLSFSAHADYEQTSTFLDALAPPHVVLVHGEATEMGRLKTALERNVSGAAAAAAATRHVYTPKNVQSVQVEFAPQHVAYVVGSLAEKGLAPQQRVRGVLVKRAAAADNVVAPAAADRIVAAADIPAMTKLQTGRVTLRQCVNTDKPFGEIRLALEVMFEGVEGAGHLPVTSKPSTPPPPPVPDGGSSGPQPEQQREQVSTSGSAAGATAGATAEEGEEAVSIGGVVAVTYKRADPAAGYDSHVVLEWEGGAVGDMVADAVVAVVLQAAGVPPGVKSAEEVRRRAQASGDLAAAVAAELQLLAAVLRAQFGPAKVDEDLGLIHLTCGGQPVTIDYHSGTVACADDSVRGRVDKAINRVVEAMQPCALDYEA